MSLERVARRYMQGVSLKQANKEYGTEYTHFQVLNKMRSLRSIEKTIKHEILKRLTKGAAIHRIHEEFKEHCSREYVDSIALAYGRQILPVAELKKAMQYAKQHGFKAAAKKWNVPMGYLVKGKNDAAVQGDDNAAVQDE